MGANPSPAFERMTLYYDGQARAGVLVTNRDGRRSERPKHFRDPHAALDWCIAHSAAFVFTPGAAQTN